MSPLPVGIILNLLPSSSCRHTPPLYGQGGRSQKLASMRAWTVVSVMAITMAAPALARAQDARPVRVGATLASDYVSRGLSRSNGRASSGLGVDVSKQDIYAGAWVSSVGGLAGAEAEVLLYAGWRPDWSGWNFDLGAIGRDYPGANTGHSGLFIEAQMSASQIIGPLQYGGRVFYTARGSRLPGAPPPITGASGAGTYFEFNGAYALRRNLKLSGAIGRQQNGYDTFDSVGGRRSASYNTWNLGLGYDLSEKLNLDLRYWNANGPKAETHLSSGLVASLTATF